MAAGAGPPCGAVLAAFDDATRVAYRPEPGYTGLDSFVVYDHDDYDTFPYQVTVNRSSSF
jgi:hypothetical protein